ncbi:MAG: long-chain fatty acid--CoA ligase, partial [Nitriliruptor sp.]
MSEQLMGVREELLARTEGRTLLDVFAATCDANWNRPALVIKEGDGFRTLTWGEYRTQASHVAMALRGYGVRHGDHVALMMTNRPEHVVADVGALMAGGVPVSVYNTLATDQIRYIAENCAAKVAILEDAAFLATWDAVREQLPALEVLVVVDPTGVDVDGRDDVITYAELLERGERALETGHGELENSWRGVTPDDAVTLIYTSGTTG